jgi:hypothetical protein
MKYLLAFLMFIVFTGLSYPQLTKVVNTNYDNYCFNMVFGSDSNGTVYSPWIKVKPLNIDLINNPLTVGYAGYEDLTTYPNEDTTYCNIVIQGRLNTTYASNPIAADTIVYHYLGINDSLSLGTVNLNNWKPDEIRFAVTGLGSHGTVGTGSTGAHARIRVWITIPKWKGIILK